MTDLKERRGLDTQVYAPAEDSHLLAKAAVEEVAPTDDVLDAGTGSGFIAETIATETGATVIGTDINPHACQAAADRGVETLRADLVAPFAPATFDVVVCNPPYLPEEPAASFDDWMHVALAGGASGQAVINRLLEEVNRVLRPDGIVLVLVSTVTGVDAVVERAAKAGFSAVAVAEESFPFETLTVLKLV